MDRTAGRGGRPHRVVIVGGGFGGLFAARALRRSDVAITLVDRAQHHLFQPLLYQVATAADPDEQRRWLTFAVVGAGPTGVELAGQIRELATRTLRTEFRRIRPENARVLLFDGGTAPLASFGPALSAKAAAALRDLGVELHLGSIVTGVDGEGLNVRDGAGTTVRHEAGTVLWAAGVEAPPVAEALAAATGAQRDRAGRIQVQPDLTIPGHPEISVVGDMMSLKKLPGVAEVAMQSGLYAGRRIRHRISDGKTIAPFRYYDLGSAAYLSRGNAVVSAGPLRFAGFAGWLGWLLIHIAFLTGFRNRAGAILTWAAAFARDARRERTFTTQQIERLHDVYDAEAHRDRMDRRGRSAPPASRR